MRVTRESSANNPARFPRALLPAGGSKSERRRTRDEADPQSSSCGDEALPSSRSRLAQGFISQESYEVGDTWRAIATTRRNTRMAADFSVPKTAPRGEGDNPDNLGPLTRENRGATEGAAGGMGHEAA